jgi:cytochrome c oxidase assembly factor CtaG
MTPLGVIGLVMAGAVAVGAWRQPTYWRTYRFEVLGAFATSLVLSAATMGPLDQLGMRNLTAHMIAHVVVMFLVPIGFLLSGAGHQVWNVVPKGWSGLLDKAFARLPKPSWTSRVVIGTLALNAVMVVGHLPVVFNAIMVHMWAMSWLMEPAFLLSGLAFFSPLVVARPHQWQGRLRWQLAAVAVTMLEMLVMAMAMSIFTKAPWYTSMGVNLLHHLMPSVAVGHLSASQYVALVRTPGFLTMPGMNMSVLTPAALFHQQQLAAAVLWICGDFWAVPLIVVILRRAIARDGSLLKSLDRSVA